MRWADPEKVKKMFREPDSTMFGEYIKKRIPMQWGGLSDPFDLMEPKLGIGLELMKFFREIDYPISFSTKSVWMWKVPEYIEVLKGAKNFHFKITIITIDEEKARKVEQRVAAPSERLKTIEELVKLGVAGVTLRLRPFIIGVSSPRHLELIEEAAKRGAMGVSTEFFCLETRSKGDAKKRFKEISEAAGYDIREYYRMNTKGAGYLRLNYEVMRPYMEQMEQKCKELGIGFWVSDAKHKERSCSGACCGLPKDDYFSNFQKCQFTQAITIAKDKGEVRFSDIAQYPHDFFEKSKAELIRHTNTKTDSKMRFQSIYDYMRSVWNTPKSNHSPYHYFDGMLIPTGLDENQDVIYKFNQEKYEGKNGL